MEMMASETDEFGARLVEKRTNRHGFVTWYKIEVFHHGLNEVRTVGDSDFDVVKRKANALLSKMTDKWARLETQERSRAQTLGSKVAAESRTAAATADLERIRTLLSDGVSSPVTVNWEALCDKRPFSFGEKEKFPWVEFGSGNQPMRARVIRPPEQPNSAAAKYHPPLTFLDRVWPPSRKAKSELASSRLKQDIDQWKSALEAVKKEQEAAQKMYQSALSAYEKDRNEFEGAQAETNAQVAAFKASYVTGDAKAVSRYCEMLLGTSLYPDFLDLEFSVGFNPLNGMAVIECELPDKDAVPTLQKVTFVSSSRETKEKHITVAERDRLYDSLLYQVALRAIFELIHGDEIGVLKLVVFNGWVDALNPATGQRNHGCILSLQASKDEFNAIDLARVEPRACFKQLKGVSAARLSGMSPVRPILQLQTDDPRFVSAYAVADQLESGYNLATMDWEDFEHLVRELFEKEFGQNGAEVHVTRVSSDGGVDAVVLDPDPIRGGKIVIQAKRYTNTVGLSAVRDLYGTVINEGANRGILVSTADYGSDSYEFVKGKPLSLLNGSNLLSLLEKHGHKARIDLKEAKIVNALNRDPSGH
jgi:restriction system protein